jgi:DNA-binding NarL/FixJ family response regulator
MIRDGDEMHARGRLAELLARSPVRQRLVTLLLRGESRKEIASALQRSPHTIDAHLIGWPLSHVWR